LSAPAPPDKGVWNLHIARFRGVPFSIDVGKSPAGVQSAEGVWERRVDVHEYPYVDGANTFDLGMRPVTHRFTVIFFGPAYLDNFRSFLDSAWKIPGVHTLDHPIYGPIQAQALRMEPRAHYAARRALAVDMTFIESGINQPTFDSTAPPDIATATATVNQSSLDSAVAMGRVVQKVIQQAGLVKAAIYIGSTPTFSVWGALSAATAIAGMFASGALSGALSKAINRGSAASSAQNTQLQNRGAPTSP